ncbi:hypothetical protein QBC36DRAFT_54693 [Triangularia setosa]|uniref:Uncharacterized protein n=1 Tax=Triangularia setosa TaxID=2587417 RepID=A0AAN6W251_9PEZI|nr:hypothetical protein QBC36DRAFT_54693 [Podospora setosa]
MPSFDRVYGSSPVLAMPPQAVHQGSLGKSLLQQHQAMSLNNAYFARCPSSVAGRKRSRDEAAVNLDPPEKVVEAPVIKTPEEEYVYGPGMMLIKKNATYVADASSQSGTWVEEQAAKEEARKMEAAVLAQQQLAQSRPSLRSHKSQRLAVSCDDSSPTRRSIPNRASSSPLLGSSDSLAQPVVDDFTLHLGIGWSRISDDEHIQAAARGWARFIQNHYPVTNAKILLQSRGLQSYLVEASEGYFLFAENLRQGRLVSTTADRALQNLRTTPPVFDGPATMEASESPRPLQPTSFATHITPVTSVEIDMN